MQIYKSSSGKTFPKVNFCISFIAYFTVLVHCSQSVKQTQAQIIADNDDNTVSAESIKINEEHGLKFRRSVSKVFSPLVTTAATPILTTPRYFNKSYQHQINYHHRNYELDLERDHALPTSAPNADILKSNSNPTYPNPNRHHSHDRDRNRLFPNTTPQPFQTNIVKIMNPHIPTKFYHINENQSQSPPARSFFTPPLPPEYQHPFADKPTLRGSNNDIILTNSNSYINRRPIPPPSLMPGHERIPLRPPDFSDASSRLETNVQNKTSLTDVIFKTSDDLDYNNSSNANENHNVDIQQQSPGKEIFSLKHNEDNKEVLPNIRRILSGSNEKKIDIPEVLLNQVTKHSIQDSMQPTTSPVLFLENILQPADTDNSGDTTHNGNSKTNKINSFLIAANDTGGGSDIPRTSVKLDMTTGNDLMNNISLTNSDYVSSRKQATTVATSLSDETKSSPTNIFLSSTPSIVITSSHTTWSIAWNIHIYLSVVLFTILSVYSAYKMLVYNKLTFLFSQSYFICINLFLISICLSRIFYLCYDAYNLHDSFDSFISDILLNLPATLLTTTFAVLILFLFLKSLNHKNNRYSALVRPLTVVVGCGVHIVLCITLHYVEFYTSQNQHKYFLHQQLQNQRSRTYNNFEHIINDESNIYRNAGFGSIGKIVHPPPAARVLSLICQIIYIFVCFCLGLLYIYLYKVLKRILHSKSQNYIHGHQTLSYGIHITIATALLFVLLGALQIFGAISISAQTIPKSSSEMDWLQWGYQFSLRLVEIAIITLLAWVAGLKVNNIRNDNSGYSNNSVRMVTNNRNVFGPNHRIIEKDKRIPASYSNQNNLHGFFFPCTSNASKDQLEADYPAVCNTNTNIHNYTMRTGKLIYDDNFALTSFHAENVKPDDVASHNDFQLSQNTYQYPYNNENLMRTHNNGTITSQGVVNPHQFSNDCNHYSDCVTEATTDHYENPNFDLKTSMPKTPAGQAGAAAVAATSASVDPKIIENCYAEPNEEHHHLDHFDRPAIHHEGENLRFSAHRYNNTKKNDMKIFNSEGGGKKHVTHRHQQQMYDKSRNNHCLDRFPIDYDSIDRIQSNIRSTINNDLPSTSLNFSFRKDRQNGAQTLVCGEKFRNKKNANDLIGGNLVAARNLEKPRDSEPDIFIKQSKDGRFAYFQKQDIRQSSEDDEDIISGSNVECTNLINNEDGSFKTNSSSLTDQGICSISSYSDQTHKKGLCLKTNLILQNHIPPPHSRGGGGGCGGGGGVGTHFHIRNDSNSTHPCQETTSIGPSNIGGNCFESGENVSQCSSGKFLKIKHQQQQNHPPPHLYRDFDKSQFALAASPNTLKSVGNTYGNPTDSDVA